MLKKTGYFFRAIGRNWFSFLVFFIVFIFFYNQILGIWLTILTIIIFTLSYIPSLFFKKKLITFMKGFDVINDISIAKRLKRQITKIRKKMFLISKNQKKKKWLIVFLDNAYIFYNEKVIQTFKELYEKGYGEKEILEEIKNHFNINTRAEIKVIENTLVNQKRLGMREEPIKSYREIHKFMPN